jgi:hypothetical protein
MHQENSCGRHYTATPRKKGGQKRNKARHRSQVPFPKHNNRLLPKKI